MAATRRVYLCRHGDALSDDDAPDQLFSVGNHRLSPRGVAQAEALRDALADAPLDAVVASPLQRALHTAEVVAAPHGLKLRPEPRLVELGFSAKDAPRDYATVLQAIWDHARALQEEGDATLPSGESHGEVTTRVLAAINDALDAHEHALVVAHGAVNRVVIAHALGMPPGHLFRLEQDPACLNLLERRGDRWRVRLLNHAPWRSIG